MFENPRSNPRNREKCCCCQTPPKIDAAAAVDRSESSREQEGGGRGGRRSRAAAAGGPAYSRKEKALGLLSQRFIQLFLTSRSGELQLEAIAATLLGAPLPMPCPRICKRASGRRKASDLPGPVNRPASGTCKTYSTALKEPSCLSVAHSLGKCRSAK